MVDPTTAVAAILGVALGVVMIAVPEAIVRVHTAGRMPGGRHGEYGTDGVPDRWTLVVRVLGVAVALAGLYFGWQVL